MTIDERGKIDILSTSPEDGTVRMSIVDHHDWADVREHLIALENKLNAYIEFVESGQILEDYPNAARAPRLELRICVAHEPPPALFEYLDEVRPTLAKVGLEVDVEPSPTLAATRHESRRKRPVR